MAPASKSLAERFWPKVDKNGPIPPKHPELGPCWIWTAATLKTRRYSGGYGVIGSGGHYGHMLYAHRVAYELTVGPIPTGWTLDHLCNRRACVNPAHLDPCTIGTNSTRAADRRESCRRGHLWAEHTYIDPKTGYRRCRACNTEKAREYRQRRSRGAPGRGDAPLRDAFPAAPGADL